MTTPNRIAWNVSAAPPVPRCPSHKIPLDGGPVRFRCQRGHSVPAADIDREFHSPGEARS